MQQCADSQEGELLKKLLPIIFIAGVAGSVGLSYLGGSMPKKVITAVTLATPPEELRKPAARLSDCSVVDDCDGGWIERPNKCICYTSNPNPITNEITNVNTLPENQKIVLVGCCTANNVQYTRWQVITDPIGSECKKILNEKLYGADDGYNVDLGLAEELNQECCGTSDGPVIPGISGICPFCTYECKSGSPSSTPHGCDAFCGT